MKYKVRVALLLVALALCVVYVLWPNVSYQNSSFYDLLPTVQRTVGPKASPEEKCLRYFEVLRQQGLAASASRYLSAEHIANHVGHLHMYLHCYVEQDFAQPDHVASIGRELLPMFSYEMPKTDDWLDTMDGRSFWRRAISATHGRGIVVSVVDSHVDYAARLLRVLARLGNTLPVQFVHGGELSGRLVQLLQRVAGEQTVTFVDVSSTLNGGFRSAFKGYNNKWFAALFSAFEEFILMDADVVPFVLPALFFDLDGYKKTGAYFFRDRELSEQLSEEQRAFLADLVPAGNLLFGEVFGTAKLDNNFFNYRCKHVAESGVVVMDRRLHTAGLLMSVALQYWYRTGHILYGDKDLFWMGQLVAGNHNFHFNKHAASAVGVLEDDNTICAAQLGHLDDDKRLLWINGGLHQCKKNTWLADYVKYPYLRQKFDYSVFALRASYSQPVTIEAAVLPASISALNRVPDEGGLKGNFNKRYNRGCGGIYYCAEAADGGEVVRFGKEERQNIAAIILEWTGPYGA